MLKIEKESTRSRSVGNFLWKRLWTCSKTDCRMKDQVSVSGIEWPGVKLITHLTPVPMLRMSGSITTIPLYVFMVWKETCLYMPLNLRELESKKFRIFYYMFLRCQYLRLACTASVVDDWW